MTNLQSALLWAGRRTQSVAVLRRIPWQPILLLGACGALFFYALGRRDLWGSHEARAAQNAQRMLDDETWALPRLFDDQYDFQKPPMFYWLPPPPRAGRLRAGAGVC